MSEKDIFLFCKELGCCEICCIRYLGIKSPIAYRNTKEFASKFQPEDEKAAVQSDISEISTDVKTLNGSTKNDSHKATDSDDTSPPNKKRKLNVCVSCLGVLQEETWPESLDMVQEVLEKKRYECSTFACALSAPMATIVREKAVTLRIGASFPNYDEDTLTPLKEAWKWSFGARLAQRVGMPLDSGAVSPLLVTLNLEYPHELQELEVLKKVSPSLFESRSRQRRRFATEFTRSAARQALAGVRLEALLAAAGGAAPTAAPAPARCASVVCARDPLYLAGRYIKLSRELPQTPWVVEGRRVMPSSVQEIIFEPLADLYGLEAEQRCERLKLVAAGREDVDVRCLGDGRPFAVEIADPRRQLTAEELADACRRISASGQVVVKQLVPVTREDLTLLKKGEETKTKTYEALCIKLSHSPHDQAGADRPVRVTAADIDRINTYRNTDGGGDGDGDGVRVVVAQRTPIRVLHRRPLLERTRHLLQLHAAPVPEHPQLVRVRVTTSAGTYVKEWAHGELRRTRPALRDALGARADLLALDVLAVDLAWPPHPPPPRQHGDTSPHAELVNTLS